MVCGEQFAGYLLEFVGGDGVNLLEQALKVFLLAVVQETLAEVEGEVLAVVAGNGYLAL